MQNGLLAAYAALGTMLIAPAATTVPVPAQMIALATLVIYVASFHAAERERKRQNDGDAAEARDVITGQQAYRFPIIASVSLLSLFLAFKYLPREWVSLVLTLYGVVFGGMALANTLVPALETIPGIPPSFKTEFGPKDYFSLSALDVISMLAATPVAFWYFKTKSWLANNVLAASLGLSAIDLLALGDFKSGGILLSGLFFYDIFWVFGSTSVFGSNVMVSVAKNFEGPIKLIFPRFFGAKESDMSMLGLGDIVIPGLFIALMLRYDIREVPPTAPLPGRYPYFSAVLAAYVVGLITTIVAMQVYGHAQPALLYLVPACILTVLGLAVKKGELSELWAYSEEDEEHDTSSDSDDDKQGVGEQNKMTNEALEGKKEQ